MRLKLDKRTGPLYWCTYEKQFTENTFMPEERFKENIDWVAKEFVPYGYEMVCTDGWIEDSFCISENGYLTRHHDSWKHDWTLQPYLWIYHLPKEDGVVELE